MTHNAINKAIKDLVPNAQYVLSGIDYENIDWLDKRPKPTMAEITAAIAKPLPESEPTLAEKLSGLGVSIEELKAALK